jgi:hypothetical protein
VALSSVRLLVVYLVGAFSAILNLENRLLTAA